MTNKFTAICCLLIGFGTAALIFSGAGTGADPLAPCRTEDSINCLWDAEVQGNGLGESFVNNNGILYYEVAR